MPKKQQFILQGLIADLKLEGFNVRLSINMIDRYDNDTPEQIFDQIKILGTNQVTFRKLYRSKLDKIEDEWVSKHDCSSRTIKKIKDYIKTNGDILYSLPYGALAYSVHGISTVLDDDCMSKENNQSLKYVILREDGKLYCQWDDKGSLIF